MVQTQPTIPFVVVVDDNPEDREVIRELIPRGRVESCREYDSKRAFTDGFISTLDEANCINMPFLIFIDIRMQGQRDGIELLQEIRNNDRLRLVPAIMISGSDEQSDVYDSYSAGANLYILKDERNNGFAEAIRQTLEAFSRALVIQDFPQNNGG